MNALDLLEQLGKKNLVDLTHDLEEGIPTWPTQPKFEAETGNHQDWGDDSYWRKITFCEHSGTHIDASAHFFKGRQTVDEIPLTQIIGRAANIDATHLGERGLESVDDIRAFEEKYGEIREGDIVLFRFGWDERWALGAAGQAFMKDWPGLSKEAAEYLRDKGVHAVGGDTLAIDAPDQGDPAHKVLLGSDINIIENVDRLSEMPPYFAVIGLPCRFKGGSGSTMRLIAILDEA